jgi:hypothetical protein
MCENRGRVRPIDGPARPKSVPSMKIVSAPAVGPDGGVTVTITGAV